MYVTAKLWHGQQKTAKARAAAWPNKDDDTMSWPVLVTETIEHVIWVEAETAEAALECARTDTWELIEQGKQTCTSADINLVLPRDSWDWHVVYDNSYHSYQGLKCDAHVETTKDWFRGIEWARLDATIEDEDRDQVAAEQRKTCTPCRCWREDGHEETARHAREVEWQARCAAVEAAVSQ